MDELNIQIILIRHGETEYNREGRIQGTLDSPLTERGRLESSTLGVSMRDWLPPVHQWLVSPQGRARESSRLIRDHFANGGQGVRVLPAEELEESAREINCGDYEGKITETLDQSIIQKVRELADFPYPQGESLVDVMNRGKFVLARVIESSQRAHNARPDLNEYRVVLVSHGNFIRAFGALLTRLGPEFALRAFQSNTGVNRLVSRDGGRGFKILTWNDTSHMNQHPTEVANLGTA